MKKSMGNRFIPEQHPFQTFCFYLVFVFLLQYLLQGSFLTVFFSNLFVSMLVLFRRMVSPVLLPVFRFRPISVLAIISVVCFLSACYFWSSWYMSVVSDNTAVAYTNTINQIAMDAPLFYFYLLVLLAPCGEESLFRYLILHGCFYRFRNLRPMLRFCLSLFVSSLLFGLIHGTGVHCILGLLFGIASSLLYFLTGKFFFSILLHVIYNLGTLFLVVPSSFVCCCLLTFLGFCFFFFSIFLPYYHSK